MERERIGKSISELPSDYTVIDIETSGLSPSSSEIIEISALRVRGDVVADTFTTLLRPSRPIGWFITSLTGITNAMLGNAPDPASALAEFYDFKGDDILVGHNVRFDVNFLYDNLLRLNGLILDNPSVDTLRLARRAVPGLPDYKQVTLAEHYGIPTDGSHRALRDCEICNACYLRLKRDLGGEVRFRA